MEEDREPDTRGVRAASSSDATNRARLAQLELASRLRDEERVAAIRGGQAGAELHFRLGRYQGAAGRLESLERLFASTPSAVRPSAEVLERHAEELARAAEDLHRCRDALVEAAAQADALVRRRSDVLGALGALERTTGTSASTFRLVTDPPPRRAKGRRAGGVAGQPNRSGRRRRVRSLRGLLWPARVPSGVRT